jgi:deoxyribodipyrimidine photo-lyase
MPGSETRPVIHWFRRDLRITDNTALLAAGAGGHPVIPVYVVSSWKREHDWTGPKRQHFLCGCLESLARNLESIGGSLVIREGDGPEQVAKLIAETKAVAVHFNADPDPHGNNAEQKLAALCAKHGATCHAHHDVSLHTPEDVLTKTGQPYRVYTPFSRCWLPLAKRKPAGKPGDLRTPAGIRSLPLPTVAHWGLSVPDARLPEPGEKAARKRLKRAIAEKIPGYATHRDSPAADGTSRLSQDLRHGLISIRTVYAETMAASASVPSRQRTGFDIFIKELAWREFYFAILRFFPEVLQWEFNPDWRGLAWHDAGPGVEAWKQGRTGFPIVDAGMRELLATGHMHNRVRMITAMFLTKDLHADWRIGESFFMQHLVDGEIASNNGGWQWSAGTGADAAPYFRIQNPWSQTARYDPQGTYIRRWIPELADADPALFLNPPRDGKSIAAGYPLPCVDHKTERDRTLAMFQKHRSRRK